MCGICGVVSRRAIGPEAITAVRSMNAAMVHRGPNAKGEFVGTHIALAMRRLSIIDLSGGDQPLFSENHEIALVANGEIYNFVELRQELEARGHRFATHSDCETIVHLYEEYGDRCVDHLRGMFVFALWDKRQNRLLLVRDRMSEKPLYLYETEDALYFASEMKALLHSGVVPFVLDPTAVDLYFHYLYVPEPLTAVKNVRKLPAAHLMTWEALGAMRSLRRYWSMEDAAPVTDEPVSAVARQLDSVADMIIRSDVPVGVALSGGLDSSLIAALAVRKSRSTVAAFTVGYEGDERCDERQDAEALAKHLGMPFHSTALSAGEMCDHFSQLNHWRDDPVADPAGYSYYAVMRLARENGVPVVLQGQGGDELFWGYDWMRESAVETNLRDRVSKYPVVGRASLAASLRMRPPMGWHPWQVRLWLKEGLGLQSDYRRAQRISKAPPGEFAFMGDNPVFLGGEWVRAHYSRSSAEQIDLGAARGIFTFPTPWPQTDIRLTRLICETYLAGNGIAQGDRLSMASSVEMRLPLVDHRLVETVIGLRKGTHDYRLGPKSWLRAAARNWLPEWALTRPKRGFTPPMVSWMAALEKRYAGDLRDGFLASSGLFNDASFLEGSKDPFNRDATISVSFRLLVLESWCRAMASIAGR